MSFSNIRNILQSRSNAQVPIARQVTAALVVEKGNQLLEEIFMDLVPEQLSCLYFRSSILVVAVSSGYAAQAVREKRLELLEKLRQVFGQEVVKQIQTAPFPRVFNP